MLKRFILAIISILFIFGLCACVRDTGEPVTEPYYVYQRELVWGHGEEDTYYLVVYNLDDVEGLARTDWVFYKWQVDKNTFDNVELGDCLWITRK